MLRIWGRNTSTNVMKVIWLLEEMQVPYERLDVGGAFGGTDTPAYRNRNPTGLVPTLEEDDGFTLFESNAILRYLASSHKAGHAFWPQDLRQRADIDRWLDFQQTVMNPRMVAVFQPLIRLPAEQRDAEKIARDAKAFAAAWEMLVPRLTEHPYVAGADFTLADIPLGPLVHRYFQLPIERPDQPALRAWYDRLLARPAYAAHVARPLV
jgi:glutathione S-transferase